jgi:Spy/CpxP family protein refolding chaperone
MTIRRWFVFLVCLLAVASVGKVASAQPAKDKDKRAKVEERLEKLRERVLKKDVGLDDKKAKAVGEILTRYAGERRKIQKDQREYRRALQKLVQSDSNDQDAYKKALKSFREGRKKLQGLEDRQLDDVAKLLTPKEQVKLVSALQRFRRKLAKKLGDRD